jgi:hypothetical protein
MAGYLQSQTRLRLSRSQSISHSGNLATEGTKLIGIASTNVNRSSKPNTKREPKRTLLPMTGGKNDRLVQINSLFQHACMQGESAIKKRARHELRWNHETGVQDLRDQGSDRD